MYNIFPALVIYRIPIIKFYPVYIIVRGNIILKSYSIIILAITIFLYKIQLLKIYTSCLSTAAPILLSDHPFHASFCVRKLCLNHTKRSLYPDDPFSESVHAIKVKIEISWISLTTL